LIAHQPKETKDVMEDLWTKLSNTLKNTELPLKLPTPTNLLMENVKLTEELSKLKVTVTLLPEMLPNLPLPLLNNQFLSPSMPTISNSTNLVSSLIVKLL